MLYVSYISIKLKKGCPGSSAGKESTCNAGDPSSIPGSGRSPGEGNNYPLLYSGLENSMDCIVHGVHRLTKSQTQLSLKLKKVLFLDGKIDHKHSCLD